MMTDEMTENYSGIEINVTGDYETLVKMFIDNGLEFSVDCETPTDIIKCWDARLNGALAGGCVLAARDGGYIIDGIAVEAGLRSSGLGKRLLNAAVEEVRSRGGKTLFLVARAPDFFRKQGFITTPREDAPNFFECSGCPQYGVSCHPEVMRLEL
jgi:ribosomal protein S18 acetylase RimI-like enzyme